MGFPVVLKIVSPEILHKTEAGGVLVGVKTAEDVQKGYDTHHRQREGVQRESDRSRRSGTADARRRPGGDHRRGHRSRVRQAGRLRSGRHSGRGAQGHHVPPCARDPGRRIVDARRHRGGADSQGRPRCGSGQSRRARDHDPERVSAHLRPSGDRGNGPEPGLRHQGGGDRGRRPDRRELLPGPGAVSPEARGHRARHEPHHEAEGGRRHRRLGRGRQDRQLGDEEPDQRRLPRVRSTRSTRPPTRSWD